MPHEHGIYVNIKYSDMLAFPFDTISEDKTFAILFQVDLHRVTEPFCYVMRQLDEMFPCLHIPTDWYTKFIRSSGFRFLINSRPARNSTHAPIRVEGAERI